MAENMHQPSYALRPGVAFPDWAAVTSPQAREALLAIFDTIGVESMWRDYTSDEDAVRVTLLRLYAERGHAPLIGDLAGHAGISESAIRSHLASLKARDLVVLDPDGVRLGERTLTALCAIDALGAGAMYGRDVEISSRCRACGMPVSIATGDRGRAAADLAPGSAVVWLGIRHTDGCAANSMCTVIAFFCDDAHLEAWYAGQHPATRGFRLSIDEALQAGRAIFGPSLAGLEVTP